MLVIVGCVLYSLLLPLLIIFKHLLLCMDVSGWKENGKFFSISCIIYSWTWKWQAAHTAEEITINNFFYSIIMQFSVYMLFVCKHFFYAHNSLLSNFNKSTNELGTVIVVVVCCAVGSWIPEAIVTFELVELMT